MSYSYLPETPRARPAVVTSAVALMYVAAASLVISGLMVLSLGGPMGRAMDAAYKNQADIPENFGSSFATVVVIILAIVYALVGVGLAVLAIFTGKGRNGARITTWVYLGLLTLCCGCGGLFSALSGGAGFTGNVGSTGQSAEIDQEAMQRVLEQEMPSWYTPASAALSIVISLVGIAVIILLALPASNAYFRRQPETWTPPTGPGMPGGDPGYPGYPPPPGGPGGNPGYPPPPGSYPPPPPQ